MKNEIIILMLPIILSACSNTYMKGETLVAADEMMDGPGLFSGPKGAFYLVGGEEKVVTKPLSKMSVDDTSKLLDDKIKQLKQDQIELENLKRDLNKRNKTNSFY